MKIQDMPEFRDKGHVVTFEASTLLKDAINEMAQRNYGAVLVTEKDKLVGIFTERDLLRRVAAQGLDIKKTKLREVMSTNLKTANETDRVADSLRRMSQGRFRHLPVVSETGEILGMLSQGDFVAFTLSDIVERVGTVAKAGVETGNIKPITMLFSIFLYTTVLLIIVSAAAYWLGHTG